MPESGEREPIILDEDDERTKAPEYPYRAFDAFFRGRPGWMPITSPWGVGIQEWFYDDSFADRNWISGEVKYYVLPLIAEPDPEFSRSRRLLLRLPHLYRPDRPDPEHTVVELTAHDGVERVATLERQARQVSARSLLQAGTRTGSIPQRYRNHLVRLLIRFTPGADPG